MQGMEILGFEWESIFSHVKMMTFLHGNSKELAGASTPIFHIQRKEVTNDYLQLWKCRFKYREPYNNVAAHEELKSMMSRFDRLNIFFDIDEDGYEVIKVESTYVKRFAYQLNDESANWLMTYLSTGKSEDFGVEPSEVQKSDQTNGNEYRKNMLKLFVESKAVNIQFTPEFRDRRGQLTAVANFKFGNIFFFVNRDEDIVSYLQEKELIR